MLKPATLLLLIATLLCSRDIYATQIEFHQSEWFLPLKVKIENIQFLSALELSDTLVEEWLGDPAFDLLYGRALFGAGDYQQAVFAFERVLLNLPRLRVARLYLALTYIGLNNLNAAETELSELLLQAPSEQQQQSITRLLNRVAELRETSGSSQAFGLAAAYGYDSNVTSGTSRSSVFFDVIQTDILLPEEIREAPDHFLEYAFSYRYQKQLNQSDGYGFGLAFSDMHYNNESDLDQRTLDLSASYYHKVGEYTVSYMATAQPLWLDQRYYRLTLSSDLDVSRQLSKNSRWGAGASIATVNNMVDDNFDIIQYMLNSYWMKQTDNTSIVTIAAGKDVASESDSDENSRDFFFAGWQYQWPVHPEWLITFDASYDKSSYKSEFLAAGDVRAEETYQFDINLDYTPAEHWLFSLRTSVATNKSNIPVFDYDRRAIQVFSQYRY